MNWSAGTFWDATPVSGIDTRLFFGGTLNASAAVATANDIASPPFKLNNLTFNAAGPGTGTAPTYTLSGSQLEFITSTAPATPTMTLNAGGTVKPTLTINNALLLTNDLAIAATTSGAFGGLISGAGNLSITGPGTVNLNNTGNTFGGSGKTITVSGGGFVRTNNEGSFGGLGSSSNKLVLNGGGYYAGGFNDFGTSFNRAIELQTGGTNTILVNAGAGSREAWFFSTLTGAGGFTNAGSGAPMIIGRNDGTSTLTGTVTAATQAIYVQANATGDALASADINIQGGNFLFGGNSGSAVILANFARNISVNSANGLSASNNYTFTQTGLLTGTATLSINNVTLTQEAKGSVAATNGAGASSVVVLNGDLSGFSGGLSVSNGKLVFGTSATLPASFGLLTLANTAGALADLNGRSITVKGITTGGAAGGNIQGNSTTTANTLTIDTTGTSRSYGGAISDGGSVALNLSKIGTNTQTFTGASSYSGTTAITAGAVNLQASTGLGSTAGGTSVTSGAALELQGGITVGAEALSLDGTGISDGGALRNISGTNSFAGAITLGGATRINSDTANTTLTLTGTVSGTDTNLTVGGTGNTTIANAISTGTGSLTKDGTGTAKLSGANSQTGGTVVSNGTLIGTTGSALGTNGGLSITGGNTFAYRPTAAGPLGLGTGVLTLVDTNQIGTALGGTAGQSAMTSSAAATTSGTVTVNLSGIPGVAVTTGSNDLIAAASGLDTATYTLGTIRNATNFTVGALAITATAVSITATSETALANEYWKGGFTGATKVWAISDGSTASNWASDAGGTATSLTPGTAATVNFSATGGAVGDKTGMTLGADMNIAGIVVSDPDAIGLVADAFTLTLGTGGITVNSGAGALTLGALMNLGGAQSWTNDSSNTLTVSGNVSNGSNLLTISGTGNTAISGVIGNGSGGLTKSGNGILTLSGANTYTGATTVTAGTLSLTNAAGLANTSSVSLASGARLDVNVANGNLSKVGTGVAAGSFLRFSANQAGAGAANGPGTIFGTVELNTATVSPNYTLDLGTGAKLTNINGASATYGGAIGLSGNATIESGATTFTISGGISALSAGTKSLLLTGSANGAVSGAITAGSGAVALIKEGTGRWRIGASSVTGIQITEGTLALASTSITVAPGTVTLGDTTLSSIKDATLELAMGSNTSTSVDLTVNAGSSGVLKVIRSGSGAQDFQGNIVLNNNLTLNDIKLNGTGKTVTGTGNLSVNGGVDSSFSGAGRLAFTGDVFVLSSTVTFGSTTLNSFTGDIFVNGGSASVSTNTSYVGDYTVKSGATLTNNSTTAGALGSGVITLEAGSKFTNLSGSTTANAIKVKGAVTFGQTGNGSNGFISGKISDFDGANPGTVSYTDNGVLTVGVDSLALTSATGNDFSGGLNITNNGVTTGIRGRLAILGNAVNVLGTGVVTISSNMTTSGVGPFTGTASAQLVLDANQTIAGLASGTIGANNEVVVVANNSTFRTLTLNGASGTNTFAGTIGSRVNNSNANDVKLVIAKTGANTQIFSGVNAYTGGTTVSGGTLMLSGVGTLGAVAGAVTVSGGILDLGTTSQTTGVFTMSGGLTQNGTLTSTSYDLQAGTASAVLAGSGAATKTTAGTATLSGPNTYSGVTTVSGGVLRLENATALPGGVATAGGTSNLTFNGGIIGLGSGNSSFTRALGNSANTAAATFTGAGGWAAYGADATVNLGGGGAITWATADTGFNGQTLILGASTADKTVDLQNSLDLGTAARTVQVDNGSAGIDAKLTGAITGGVGSELTKTGNGTLDLNGAPTYATLKTQAGVTNVNASFTGGTATVNANATTNFTVSQTLSALNIGSVALAAPAFAGGGASTAVVPEPGVLGLLVVGALGLAGRRRRGV